MGDFDPDYQAYLKRVKEYFKVGDEALKRPELKRETTLTYDALDKSQIITSAPPNTPILDALRLPCSTLPATAEDSTIQTTNVEIKNNL